MLEKFVLILITAFFTLIVVGERDFRRNAQQYPASVLKKLLSDREDSSGNRIEYVGRALVKLDPNFTDGRDGHTIMPMDIWQDVEVGDTIQVWAYAERPKWCFWAPMLRYEHKTIFLHGGYIFMTIFGLITLYKFFA